MKPNQQCCLLYTKQFFSWLNPSVYITHNASEDAYPLVQHIWGIVPQGVLLSVALHSL